MLRSLELNALNSIKFAFNPFFSLTLSSSILNTFNHFTLSITFRCSGLFLSLCLFVLTIFAHSSSCISVLTQREAIIRFSHMRLSLETIISMLLVSQSTRWRDRFVCTCVKGVADTRKEEKKKKMTGRKERITWNLINALYFICVLC